MQCIWLEDGEIDVRELPLPVPLPGEALIRLRLAGVCGTDLALQQGYYPFSGVPGHEFVGDVVEAPSQPSWVGRRVVGEINANCGTCTPCHQNRPTHCEHRSVLGIVNRNGVFAEYFTLPTANLHPVPSSIPDHAAVFTEPLAAACQILHQISIAPEDQVLVIGAGRLGQLIAQVLAQTGCNLSVAATYPTQKAILKDCHIKTVSPSQLPKRSSDVVVEATGNQSGFKTARAAVRPGGSIVLKSTYKGKLQVDFSSLVVDEITLIGSRCGPFDHALNMMVEGRVDPTLIIENTLPLSQGTDAFKRATRPGALKVLLKAPHKGETR